MYSDVVSVCFFVHTPSRLPLPVSPFLMLCKMNNYDASQSFPKQQFLLALLLASPFFPCIPLLPQWGTADAEINAPPIKNPEVGQNIATHASSAAENFLLVLISTSTVHFLLVVISTPTVHFLLVLISTSTVHFLLVVISTSTVHFLLVLISTSTVHFLLVLISTSTVHSPSFFLTPLHTF